MPIPTSAIFTEADWNQRFASTPDIGDRAINDTTEGVLSNSTFSQGAIYADAGLLLRANATNKIIDEPETATLRIDLAVPTTFTFEIDFTVPLDAPEDFSSQDDRIFVGAINPNGATAGFLISKAGLAVAASPFSPFEQVQVLQGSRRFLYDEEGLPVKDVTLRCTVDGDLNRLTVFLGENATVYATDLDFGDHAVAYSIPAIASTIPINQMLLAIRSPSSTASDYRLVVRSLRLASGVVATPNKPVAVLPFLETALVGRRLILDGRQSFSPDGSDLTYHWEIEEAPATSVSQLKGGTAPMVSIGTVGADNKVDISHKRNTEKKDGFTVNVVTKSGANPLAIELLEENNVRITLQTDISGTPTTTAAQLVSALTVPTSVGYNADVAAELTAELDPAVNGLGLSDTGFLTLTGGKGSTRSKTSIQVDQPGIYRFSLRVSDSSRTSDPVIATMSASLDRQLLGHRPNMNYVWRSISDFWNLVNDKETMSTAWSATAQIVSDELTRLIQHDYAKSIRDISRKFQRRWLTYQMDIPVPTSLQNSLKLDCGAHYFVKPDVDHLTPGSGTASFSLLTKKGTLIDPVSGAPLTLLDVPLHTGKTITVNSNGTIGKTSILSLSDETPFSLEFSTTAQQAVEVIDSGNFALIMKDPDPLAPDPFATNYMTHRGVPLRTADIEPGDFIVMDIDGSVITRLVDSTAPVFGTEILENVITFTGGDLEVTGVQFKWQIVRPVAFNQVYQFPFFDLGFNVDIKSSRVRFGDAAEVTYVNPLSGETVTTQVPILHTTTSEVYVDWRPLFNALNLLSETLFAAEDPILAGHAFPPVFKLTADSPVFTSIRLKSLKRTEKIPVRANLISVPKLSESTVSQDLNENADYTITPGLLNLTPFAEVVATTQFGSNRVQLFPSIEPSTLVSALNVLEGEIGTYTILDVATDGSYVDVAHKFKTSGEYTSTLPRYSFNSVIPSRLWAEVSYFDNWETIQNNFGTIACLPYQKLIDNEIELDYLSLVKAVWYAFMQGPTIYNLKVASEAFLGLPYSEVEGQVTVINPTESDRFGRIVVKEVGTPGYRTYFYPNVYPIGINPDTGRKIQAVSLKTAAKDFRSKEDQVRLQAVIDDPLSSQTAVESAVVELEKAKRVDDSRIRAYTGLVDAVRVFDYVSEKELTDLLFPDASVLEKFHTFVVQIPTEGLNNLNFLPVLKEMLLKWKPAHTNFVLFGRNVLVDQIDVEDEVFFDTTLIMNDGLYTTPVIKNNNLRTWPTDKTYDNNPDSITWDYDDVEEKYESSYVNSVLDDYSGDGSWNTRHQCLDMVNTMDSDIDVLASKMWVAIEKDVLTPEFELGEELEILVSGVAQVGLGWDASAVRNDSSPGWAGAPPVVDHISSGVHPKIPFNVFSPQNAHPHAFLLLGFYRPDGVNNFGTENRLRALERLDGVGSVRVRGLTSGAEADVPYLSGTSRQNLDKALDVDDPDHLLHKWYYIIDRIFDFDSFICKGPETDLFIQPTFYIPLGGTLVHASTPVADPYGSGSTSTLELNSPFVLDDLELQKRPFNQVATAPYIDPTLLDSEQLAPSFGPGFYVAYTGITIGVDEYKWGYTDAGELTKGGGFSDWTSPAGVTSMENLHMGRRVLADKSYHKTHGFTEFFIPKPEILLASESAGTMRIEGNFFVEDDPTRVAVPTATPSSFDGTIGGGWVFVRDSITLVEIPVVSYTFETGFHGAKTVLGISGATQISTGHIIEAPVPAGVGTGLQDIIVRNYRPYVMSSGGPTLYHMDEAVILEVFGTPPPAAPEEEGGFGTGGSGTAPFGG